LTTVSNDLVNLSEVQIDNEIYYQISNVDRMRPFFMSIMSDANHWLFVGSNGGLSAGRKNAEHALFPYYTDDKIIESVETTGPKTIVRVQKKDTSFVWEPFSIHRASLYRLQLNLYKGVYGNTVILEEINQDLGLTFRYQWCTSQEYGFVRKCTLINSTINPVCLSIADGLQNILPAGVGSALQSRYSNLVDAYKRSELDRKSGVGMFALSAIIVDKAEPSEALRSNIVWSYGISNAKRLLSSNRLNDFRNGVPLQEEEDVKAERGAYFVVADFELPASGKKEWMLVADVNKSATQIRAVAESVSTDNGLLKKVNDDIAAGTQKLRQLTAASDGLQLTADGLKDTRHFSNTMFNIARGGIFDSNYEIEKTDLFNYLAKANRDVFENRQRELLSLPPCFSLSALEEFAASVNDRDLLRLCLEYLPLKFSRRHGDPSRPWNQFSINTQNENDGSKVLDYAGNWRDIFQNWEALAHSYPEFIDGMIVKFLNASTFDGYNPYRITKYGIDWEKIEPDDPWSYIGYWGDHQIIYLLKFLEFAEAHTPGKLAYYFNQDIFVYANVPYRIKNYEQIVQNPKDTIDFDHAVDHDIQKRWSTLGSDSALLKNRQDEIHHVNFAEKILATVLSKISNFIPEGGIWMNTQRPEWNDANNALVGNGVSVVTLCYLRRFLVFFNEVIQNHNAKHITISEELANFLDDCYRVLMDHRFVLDRAVTNTERKTIMDGLGNAGSEYRLAIYANAFSNSRTQVTVSRIAEFSTLCVRFLEHTIRSNKRSDNLYHAYNLLTIENEKTASLSYLSEMLEGQVAVLSSGFLTSREALQTLDALKASALFREDQYSYLLYPNKNLKGFLSKSIIESSDLASSALLTKLLATGNTQIVEQDVEGIYRFNSNFRNATDLTQALENLDKNRFPFSQEDVAQVRQIFERVFNHKSFTGRSGTFFGYEGLGSIYWHMVSKLQLAVLECCQKAIRDADNEMVVGKLLEHYYEINEGIGLHKSPTLYGAFPTDPYSHTPANKGAQQPGMTGQVKEDILSRFGELGVVVNTGCLCFDPSMLRRTEFLETRKSFLFSDVVGEERHLDVPDRGLCFTYCQVPVLYLLAEKASLCITLNNNETVSYESLRLEADMSSHVFGRTGRVTQITVYLQERNLR
jgi:hypothetical protein